MFLTLQTLGMKQAIAAFPLHLELSETDNRAMKNWDWKHFDLEKNFSNFQ